MRFIKQYCSTRQTADGMHQRGLPGIKCDYFCKKMDNNYRETSLIRTARLKFSFEQEIYALDLLSIILKLLLFVDDELPEYIMVMIANKRTKEQMVSDLNLFLSEEAEKFVSW